MRLRKLLSFILSQFTLPREVKGQIECVSGKIAKVIRPVVDQMDQADQRLESLLGYPADYLRGAFLARSEDLRLKPSDKEPVIVFSDDGDDKLLKVAAVFRNNKHYIFDTANNKLVVLDFNKSNEVGREMTPEELIEFRDIMRSELNPIEFAQLCISIELARTHNPKSTTFVGYKPEMISIPTPLLERFLTKN